MRFPLSCREVVVGEHRADIRFQCGLTIEVQHTKLSSATIDERQDFYKWLIWLIDPEQWVPLDGFIHIGRDEDGDIYGTIDTIDKRRSDILSSGLMEYQHWDISRILPGYIFSPYKFWESHETIYTSQTLPNGENSWDRITSRHITGTIITYDQFREKMIRAAEDRGETLESETPRFPWRNVLVAFSEGLDADEKASALKQISRTCNGLINPIPSDRFDWAALSEISHEKHIYTILSGVISRLQIDGFIYVTSKGPLIEKYFQFTRLAEAILLLFGDYSKTLVFSDGSFYSLQESPRDLAKRQKYAPKPMPLSFDGKITGQLISWMDKFYNSFVLIDEELSDEIIAASMGRIEKAYIKMKKLEHEEELKKDG